MTLEEAIKHCEEKAEELERRAEEVAMNDEEGVYQPQVGRCRKCASEHRQLAKWLRELKLYRDTLIDRPCSACKFKKDNGCCKWACVFEGSESK